MDRDVASRLVLDYIDGWRECDRAKILGTLDPDCVVIECYGPVYRGTGRVGEWIDAWFGEGNTVDSWEITSLLAGGTGVAIEWRFACTWHGAASAFEGASVARLRGYRIIYLREYATTVQLYDGEGTWHP